MKRIEVIDKIRSFKDKKVQHSVNMGAPSVDQRNFIVKDVSDDQIILHLEELKGGRILFPLTDNYDYVVDEKSIEMYANVREGRKLWEKIIQVSEGL